MLFPEVCAPDKIRNAKKELFFLHGKHLEKSKVFKYFSPITIFFNQRNSLQYVSPDPVGGAQVRTAKAGVFLSWYDNVPMA
jgi:hypothetical protein